MADLLMLGMHPWQRPVRCTTGPEPGARAAMAHWMESVLGARSLGIFNCRTIGGSTSLSTHAEGRAIDGATPVVNNGFVKERTYDYLRFLAPHCARLGVTYLIWDRHKYRASGGGRPEPYGGRSPHIDHFHMEFTRAAASNLTLATFRAVVGDFRNDPIGSTDDTEDEVFLPLYHTDGFDSGRTEKRSDVAMIQATINRVPGGPRLTEDGKYGDATAAAIVALGLDTDEPRDGRKFTGSMWGKLLDRVLAGAGGSTAHSHQVVIPGRQITTSVSGG